MRLALRRLVLSFAIVGGIELAAPRHLTAQALTVNRISGDVTIPGSAHQDGCAPLFNGPLALAIDNRDNVYVADTLNFVVRKITPGGVATTLAGRVGVPGDNEGPGSAARFYALQGITTDQAGNVYVADAAVHNVKRIAPNGTTTKLVDATRASGAAVDGTGTLFYNNGHAIYKRWPDGIIELVAGSATTPGFVNATGAAARFYAPSQLSLDTAGNLYVVDQTNRAIRKINSAGAVTTFAEYPVAPQGVAVGPNGNIYGSADRVYEYTPAGILVAQYGSSTGTANDGDVAEVPVRGALAVDSSGRIYVAQGVIRRISGGRVSTFAGHAPEFRQDHGPCTARFAIGVPFDPKMALATDMAGNIFVADFYRITKLQRNGSFTEFATLTRTQPIAATTDAAGNVYVLAADGDVLTKYAPDGTSTPLGNGYRGGGVAVDASGNVYVSSYAYHIIWKVTQQPFSVSMFAGVFNSAGANDGPVGTGRMAGPRGLAIDGAGNLYVADTGNSTIRKITPAGHIATIAGTPGEGSTVDGDRNTARLQGLREIAYDASGDLYVSQGMISSTDLIRRVTQSGNVTTVAGSTMVAEGYANGTGSEVRFRKIRSLASDATGRLYIADAGNASLRVGFVASSSGQTVSFSSSTFSANEASAVLPVTVQRNSAAGNMTVDVTVTLGTATNPADFYAETVKVTLFDGETSKTYDVPVLDDTRDEPDETVNVSLSNPTGGAVLGMTSSATGTIVDDDMVPAISINDSSVLEGNSGVVAARFVVSLSAMSTQPVSVTYSTGGGTATAGTDYAIATGTLTFNPSVLDDAGETAKVITVNVNGETDLEGDETFGVMLSSPVNATIGDGSGTGTIIDDDGSRVIAFSSPAYSVNEGSTVTITVVRTGELSGEVAVNYATSSGSATAGNDYATTGGTLTFAAGETTKSFTITTFEDTAVESDETFTVSLSNPTGAGTIGSPGTATVVIYDQDTVRRGDANGDGTLTILDVFWLISSLFNAGPPPVVSGDTSNDGSVTPADVIFLLAYLFAGGPAPPPA